ncbi:fatty-acid amide hydrolase 2-B [Tetranychus urticae]|uniref:fatty-acid amide hydrolase 2-B n=1 Tax=Tetranychus urticae TaxID=32264 RepID=UPI00077BD1DF|nr:fatty-acid amide hydrolase 2-B [Tetranychus urticae]
MDSNGNLVPMENKAKIEFTVVPLNEHSELGNDEMNNNDSPPVIFVETEPVSNPIMESDGNECKINMDPIGITSSSVKMSPFRVFLFTSIRLIFRALSSFVGLFICSSRNALPPIKDPLLLKPATTLVPMIKSGSLKSETLIKAYISRIREVQPHLNAVVQERFDKALVEARQIDEAIALEIKNGVSADEPNSIRRKPLLGLPLTTKNSLGVQGMIMDTGSVPRAGTLAEKDAEAIGRARQAGAIIICITNTPELVLWYDSHNFVYGRTNNPYDLARIPGGSSGGEGALISSCGSLMGVGSDVGGSIRIPSFYCGVFGHATSPGGVPVTGMYPPPCRAWANHLSFGPICRYASDLRLLLKALSQTEGSDPLKLDETASLDNLTIYYFDDIGNPLANPAVPEIKEAIQKTLEHFRSNFNARIEKISHGKMSYSLFMWAAQLSSGDAYPMAVEAALRRGRINPYWELVKFCFHLSQHTLPVILMSLFESIGPKKGSPMHDKVLEKGKEMKNHFTKLLGPRGLIICPTLPIPAVKHRTTLLNGFDPSYTMFSNVISFPSTHCPTGLTKEGLPVGFQIIVPPFNDNLAITMACEVEKLFGGWISPSAVNC